MKTAFLYFIFCPFLGFINALKSYRSSWAKPTVIAFVAFFGFSMVKSVYVDSSRYVYRLQEMHASVLTFDDIKATFYDEEDGQADIYLAIITYFFSLFTDNGDLFFMFLGLFFGYFYANNIWLVLDESKGRLNWQQYLLLATFSMVVGFWTLNGVRMWTAAHVFFYGTFLYLYHNKKSGILIAISSVLIHFSFFLPVGILAIYSLVRLNFRFIYFFYVATFFLAELNIGFIKSTLESNLPQVLQPRVKSYLNEEYIQNVNDTYIYANWYITYFDKFLVYFLLVFFSVLFFKADMSKAARKLLGFSMLFLAIANLINLLPSGGRFLSVGYLFAFATCFIVVTKTKLQIVTNSLKYLSPLLILFCIISIRMSFDFINITTLTNPFVVMLTDIDKPIIEFFKFN